MDDDERIERLVGDLSKKVNDTAVSAATTATHVQHLAKSTDTAWLKLDRLDKKLDDTAKEILAGLPCVQRQAANEARFAKLELAQGVTTTKVAGLIAGVFIFLEFAIWAMGLAWKHLTGGPTP